MKPKTLLMVTLIAFSCCGVFSLPTATAQTMNDVHVLFVLSDGFGWSYFTAQEYFDNWGVQTTSVTRGSSLTVAACHNRPYRSTTADYLLTDFDLNTLTNYDCVFIPAGGNWPNLRSSQMVCDLISTAHANGLIIATFCIGNTVVAGANNLVTGVKVASFSMSNDEMTVAGANIVGAVRIVCDNRIITGSEGGGIAGGGYTTAPIYEACAMVVKMALQQSFVQSVQVIPTTTFQGTGYSISVETIDPASNLPGINTTTISTVTAQIYSSFDHITPITSLTLTDSDTDGTYTGTLTGLTTGPYFIDIEVHDSDHVLEVIRNTSSIFPALPIIIGGAVAVVGVMAVIGVLFYRKRKSAS
ncbi:MAG: DJ-1/PfpI family protein [Candidatus Hermodarchaeota archaeon]